MSSSTSSSRRPIPEGPWGATLLLALALFAGAVALIERAWRRYGMVPSSTSADSKDLWDYERGRIHAIGRRPLFLVGDSRLLCDTDLDVISRRLPRYQVDQLAVMGKTPIATLRDLADDESVHDAAVVVAVAEHAFERRNWNEQEPWVRHYHASKNLAAGYEAHAKALVESWLVVANPATGLQNLLEGRWPKRDYVTYGPDRSCSTDYSLVDRAKARQSRTERLRSWYEKNEPSAPDAWLSQALAVEPFLHALAARNVRVAFFRPPTTGDHWAADVQHYPPDRYWNRLRARLSVPAIHFTEYPSMEQFDPPDGSHMDAHDLGPYTECFVDALADHGIVDGATPSHCLSGR